jgi:hypothetical protein
MIDLRGQSAAVVRGGASPQPAPSPDPSKVVITRGQSAAQNSAGEVVEL